MVIRISIHGGILRISASFYASSSAVGCILSACRRRRTVVDLPFSPCSVPFVALGRQGLYRLQKLTCHCYGTWKSHSMESQSTSLNHCTSTIIEHCVHRSNEMLSSPSTFGIYNNSSDKGAGADNWSKDQSSSENLKLEMKKIQHSVLRGLETGQIRLMMKHYDSQSQVNNINGWETDSETYFPVLESENECVINNIHSNFNSLVVESQLQSEPSKSCSYFHPLEESRSDNQEVQINLVPESCNNINKKKRHSNEPSVNTTEASKKMTKFVQTTKEPNKEKLSRIYDKVLVVENISTAKEVVQTLTSKYRNLIHACDTEVANIDVNFETPVGHGEVICFSIYSGAEADFGDGKSCIWVDVLDGGRSLLMEFVPFFEDPSIKKVWHNYSFDNHILKNYGVKLAGFHADTMHLARLWDSSRRAGGYSLEALTSDAKVMSGLKSRDNDISGVKSFPADEIIIGDVSMKSIFGKRKLKKDGSEGKLITLEPLEVLQREVRKLWICYSTLDSISTKKLFNSLRQHLENVEWTLDGEKRGTMYDFYEEYWRPFGDLLVKMESEGMLVDRAYLKKMEKVAMAEQQAAANRFRKWAEAYCPDAKYMNVGSDVQIRQLFFSGTANSKDHNVFLPERKKFKVFNSETTIDKEMKSPSKPRTIELKGIVENQLETDMYTDSGWPSVRGAALKVLAGNVSADQDCMEELAEESHVSTPEDTSIYGTAYNAFGGGKKGREACQAIAALCKICSTDSLILNLLLMLQGSHISCANGRVHCSLNINTDTGRLSVRRPSLQNRPALDKDRYKIRKAFIAKPGNSFIVADYGQLEFRIIAHLANCKSMLEAFRAGGDFHSRTAMDMFDHVRQAVEENRVLLEWHPHSGESEPAVPLLKNVFASERRKAKMLNFSIAYGKTVIEHSRDWKVSFKEAKETVKRWYKERKEIRKWQRQCKKDARTKHYVQTLLGRSRHFPSMDSVDKSMRAHIKRAAIKTPVLGSAADVAMCAMLEIDRNTQLKELGWKLLLQVHDEVILEGPTESAERAKAIIVECMSKPFSGTNILRIDLSVDAKCAHNWYAAKQHCS